MGVFIHDCKFLKVEQSVWVRVKEGQHGPFEDFESMTRFQHVKSLFTSPVLICIGLVLILLAYSGCSTPEQKVWSTSGSYAPWSPDAEFVGIEACGACHQSQHDSFVRSQMGRSFRHAEKDLSDAKWEDVQPIRSDFDDLYYQPFSRGEGLFVREYRLSGKDTLHTRVERIDYIVGSGQHTNSHIYEENGFLYQIPITWYAQDGKWGLAPKFQKEGNNYRFGRVITEECMACHNGQPKFVKGSENRFEFVPEGINCEKCHGPGSIHTEEKQAGIIVDITKEIDFSIVNPGKLSPELQLDVCKRCHMQGVTVLAEGEAALDWRPGKALASHENVFWPRQPDSTTHFIMASHPDRLAMSSCFLESWKPTSGLNPITCITCHDPHSPIEEAGADLISATCVNCHGGGVGASAAQRVQADLGPGSGSGSSGVRKVLVCTDPSVVAGTSTAACASCHMPLSSSTDIPNIRITDHFIRVPGRLSQKDAGDQTRFIRLASLIDPNPNSHVRAEGFLTYFEQFTDRPGMLDSAKVFLDRATRQGLQNLLPSWIRLWHLQGDHASVRQAANSSGDLAPDAWTYYRIGEAFADVAEFETAIFWYQKAVALGKDHLRFNDKLGVALTQAGRIQEAITVYDEILIRNPLFENGLNNRGFARLMDQDIEGAEIDFKAALALSPDMELALANLASLYLNTNRTDLAIPILRQLIKKYPLNPEYIRIFKIISESS